MLPRPDGVRVERRRGRAGRAPSYTANGYLWIDVVWDDGTLQDAADDEFGDDVVVLRSALRQLEN